MAACKGTRGDPELDAKCVCVQSVGQNAIAGVFRQDVGVSTACVERKPRTECVRPVF